MKQNITKKQWDELSDENKKILKDFIKNKDLDLIYGHVYDFLNIGRMIELLGEDLEKIHFDTYNTDEKKLMLEIFGHLDGRFVFALKQRFDSLELCDALWKAVKHKLTNTDRKCNWLVDKNKDVNFIDANKKIKVYTDGATVGKNGKLGTVAEVGLGVYIPELNFGDSKRERGISNNEAEMKALIWAMQLVLDKGIDRADFFLDSEIAVNRAKGRRPSGKNKNIRLNLLQDDIFDLTDKFKEISFNWIPREQNEQADYYSKLNI